MTFNNTNHSMDHEELAAATGMISPRRSSYRKSINDMSGSKDRRASGGAGASVSRFALSLLSRSSASFDYHHEDEDDDIVSCEGGGPGAGLGSVGSIGDHFSTISDATPEYQHQRQQPQHKQQGSNKKNNTRNHKDNDIPRVLYDNIEFDEHDESHDTAIRPQSPGVLHQQQQWQDQQCEPSTPPRSKRPAVSAVSPVNRTQQPHSPARSPPGTENRKKSPRRPGGRRPAKNKSLLFERLASPGGPLNRLANDNNKPQHHDDGDDDQQDLPGWQHELHAAMSRSLSDISELQMVSSEVSSISTNSYCNNKNNHVPTSQKHNNNDRPDRGNSSVVQSMYESCPDMSVLVAEYEEEEHDSTAKASERPQRGDKDHDPRKTSSKQKTTRKTTNNNKNNADSDSGDSSIHSFAGEDDASRKDSWWYDGSRNLKPAQHHTKDASSTKKAVSSERTTVANQEDPAPVSNNNNMTEQVAMHMDIYDGLLNSSLGNLNGENLHESLHQSLRQLMMNGGGEDQHTAKDTQQQHHDDQIQLSPHAEDIAVSARQEYLSPVPPSPAGNSISPSSPASHSTSKLSPAVSTDYESVGSSPVGMSKLMKLYMEPLASPVPPTKKRATLASNAAPTGPPVPVSPTGTHQSRASSTSSGSRTPRSPRSSKSPTRTRNSKKLMKRIKVNISELNESLPTLQGFHNGNKKYTKQELEKAVNDWKQNGCSTVLPTAYKSEKSQKIEQPEDSCNGEISLGIDDIISTVTATTARSSTTSLPLMAAPMVTKKYGDGSDHILTSRSDHTPTTSILRNKHAQRESRHHANEVAAGKRSPSQQRSRRRSKSQGLSPQKSSGQQVKTKERRLSCGSKSSRQSPDSKKTYKSGSLPSQRESHSHKETSKRRGRSVSRTLSCTSRDATPVRANTEEEAKVEAKRRRSSSVPTLRMNLSFLRTQEQHGEDKADSAESGSKTPKSPAASIIGRIRRAISTPRASIRSLSPTKKHRNVDLQPKSEQFLRQLPIIPLAPVSTPFDLNEQRSSTFVLEEELSSSFSLNDDVVKTATDSLLVDEKGRSRSPPRRSHLKESNGDRPWSPNNRHGRSRSASAGKRSATAGKRSASAGKRSKSAGRPTQREAEENASVGDASKVIDRKELYRKLRDAGITPDQYKKLKKVGLKISLR